MPINVLESVKTQIRKQMNELADVAAMGGPMDWPAYQRLVGKIEGLAYAERFVLDIERRVYEDEESDDVLLK